MPNTPFSPFRFSDADLPRLSAPVGPDEVNRPEDVAKIETILNRLGYFRLNPSQGPSGIYHSELMGSLKAFQAANALVQDGVTDPRGPTVQLFAQQIAEDPGPDHIDDTEPVAPPPEDEKHPPSTPSRPATTDEAADKAAESALERIKQRINRGRGGGFFLDPKNNPRGFPQWRPLN